MEYPDPDDYPRTRRGRPSRDPFFDEFPLFGGLNFPDLNREFARMSEYMNRLMEQAADRQSGAGDDQPYVYGFSMRMGPDGRPVFQEFGNSRFLGKAAPPGNRNRVRPSPGGAAGQPRVSLERTREPLTDVIEGDDYVSVTIELPGVEASDIDLNITDSSATIHVENDERKYFKEIKFSCDVDPESARASCKNGVLDIQVQKLPKKDRGRKVKVR